MPERARKRILLQEEEVRFLEERERFWKRRRTPCKAQHEAREPDHFRWDAAQEEKTSKRAVRCKKSC